MEVYYGPRFDDSYSFKIIKGKEVVRVIYEQSGGLHEDNPSTPEYSEQEKNLIKDYLEILRDTQNEYHKICQETQLKKDLKIVDDLPD